MSNPLAAQALRAKILGVLIQEARLAARHLAADRLDFRLVLESGAVVSRQLRLPEPQTAVEGMLPPLRTLLETLRLESAVCGLELDATPTFATSAQREWFGRSLPQPERWAETLAKLEALLGPGRVGIPVPPASFKPDDFTLRPAVGAALWRRKARQQREWGVNWRLAGGVAALQRVCWFPEM